MEFGLDTLQSEILVRIHSEVIQRRKSSEIVVGCVRIRHVPYRREIITMWIVLYIWWGDHKIDSFLC